MEQEDQPGGIQIAPNVRVAQLQFRAARGGGPGGQNVNKVNTKMELRLPLEQLSALSGTVMGRLRQLAGRKINDAGELIITSQEHRSQEGNRRAILERLRQMLIEAQAVPKRRRKTKPTASSRRKRLEGKKQRGQIKHNRGSVDD